MFKKIKTNHLLKSFIFETVRFFLKYILLIPCILLSQANKKEVIAIRIDSKVDIDGELKEDFWDNIPTAENFQMIEPINGKIERQHQKTKVKFAYDDNALYVAGILNDRNAGYDDPNILGIMQELGSRDEQGKSADMFGIFLNPFNDGINEFAFLVTAAGVQIDKRIILTTNGTIEDANWDAVWESAVQIHKDGWYVEMKIPYSALRFPNLTQQEWGLNIYRELRRLREGYSWNYIDNAKSQIGNQNGLLKGISNITPPIRLSLTPYISCILLKEPETNTIHSNTFNYSGGIDLKYGFSLPLSKVDFIKSEDINCTLDMILLPEFQQVEFDPQVLNISPFETRFDEKRSFFTEGIDLFQKGNLFYSRRIGAAPINNAELDVNEILTKNPENTKLFNGTKISGRNQEGWGVGVFNAITRNTYAEILDTITNTMRQELLEPITNYNMIVLDKSFNQNSFISFVNTNVNRKSSFKNANVSGLFGSITNKKNTHKYDASIVGSFIKQDLEKKSGFSSMLNIQKINGTIKYNVRSYIESDDYDINDMGFLYQNNEINNEVNISYNIYSQDNPIAQSLRIKKGNISTGIEHKSLYKPFKYNEFIIKASTFILNQNHLYLALRARYFFEEQDWFESRIDNQPFIKPPAIKSTFITSSNFNRPISLNTTYSVKYSFSKGYQIWDNYTNASMYYRFNPRFRINNHAFLEYVVAIENAKNEFGWITENETESPIFSRRDRNTITNKLSFNYTFNPQAYIKLIARHYWSTIENFDFYQLNQNGYMQSLEYNNSENINFNTWNLDLNFSWEYRPGSLLSVVWQNQLTNQKEEVNDFFLNNLNDFFENSTTNIFSIKFTCYLDYLDLKSKNNK